MRRILVIYGSTDGHTRRIAAALAKTIGLRGFEVDVLRAGRENPRPDDYDGVVVAASVHAGRYQKPVARWVQEHSAALNTRPSAFISVCLAVLQKSPAVQQEVANTINRFVASAHWTPTTTRAVPGALLYTRYGWFKRRMMRRMVAKVRGDIDTSRDYVYTDWDDLRALAEQFSDVVSSVPRPPRHTRVLHHMLVR